MRASLLKGKTIQRIVQRPMMTTGLRRIHSLEAIEFTDGTTLRFLVTESENEYGIAAIYPGKGVA